MMLGLGRRHGWAAMILSFGFGHGWTSKMLWLGCRGHGHMTAIIDLRRCRAAMVLRLGLRRQIVRTAAIGFRSHCRSTRPTAMIGLRCRGGGEPPVLELHKPSDGLKLTLQLLDTGFVLSLELLDKFFELRLRRVDLLLKQAGTIL